VRALIRVAAAGLAGAGLALCVSSANQSATETSSGPKPATALQISIWEIHNQAHLEFLPIERIDDQKLIFNEAKR
jgi:hypothetical protein